MSTSPEEQAALHLFTDFVTQNRASLAPIASWGDGRCGAMQRIMADILLGPAIPRELPRQREAIPAAIRRRVHERDLYRCVQCGSHETLRIDHIHPWSKGGSDDEANLQTLCDPCNNRKRDKVPA